MYDVINVRSQLLVAKAKLTMDSQYRKHLIEEYGLRKESREKPVMSVEDLQQVATGLLLASFTGCRPVSLFDPGRRTGSDAYLKDAKSPPELDHPSLGSDLPDSASDRDSEYDPDSDTGEVRESMSCLRYQHIEIFLLRPKRPGDLNSLVAKVTLVHTKGEQRRSRSSA